jgi:hypothetical protein
MITPKRQIPGEPVTLAEAVRQLASAGLLRPNAVAPGRPWQSGVLSGRSMNAGPCPRCGRDTAATAESPDPSLCAGCRAESIAAGIGETDQVTGSCVRCWAPCARYGPAGSPLCPACQEGG